MKCGMVIGATLIACSLSVSGCSDAGIEFAGVSNVFHCLSLAFPHEGIGKYAISTETLEFQHDSLIITVTDIGTGTFEIRRNGELLGTAKEGQHVQFDDEGGMTVLEEPPPG